MKFLFLNFYFLGAMYLESGLKSATEFFTKLAFDEEVCSHDNLLIFFCLFPVWFLHITLDDVSQL